MRICMIGKFPPIEGGVSMHQYWYAHSLASLGHQIHVVTNASEVEPSFRIFMRQQDWSRCEGDYPGGGYVRVHWTEPFNHEQRHIPRHNPFATKLASLAARIIREHDLQLVFSYYLEPYGVAGHLAGQMTGLPHVIQHAGSDVGRLRLNPQFGPLYDHIFRCAARVITGAGMAQQLIDAGVDEAKLFRRPDFKLPTLFCPEGETLNLQQLFADIAEHSELAGMVPSRIPLPDPPYLGVYGKLGEAKGTFDLLRAARFLKQRGHKVNVLFMGHGWGQMEAKFREALADLDVTDCVTQLPFLPHWRVPEFIRLCEAVLFLERDFPIGFHTPMVPREVFACGGCLVASADILRRQLSSELLIHGFNCLAVRDVRNPEELSSMIGALLENPERAQQMARRGHDYSKDTERRRIFPRNYENLFTEVIEEYEGKSEASCSRQRPIKDEFAWTRMAMESLSPERREEITRFSMQYDSDRPRALAVYLRLLDLINRGELDRGVLVEGVRLELQMAGAFQMNAEAGAQDDELFRLDARHNPVLDKEIPALCPLTASSLMLEKYEYDVNEILAARRQGQSPLGASRRSSFAAVVPGSRGGPCRVYPLADSAVRLLELCDGSRTIEELSLELCGDLEEAREFRDRIVGFILEYFRLGLLRVARRR